MSQDLRIQHSYPEGSVVSIQCSNTVFNVPCLQRNACRSQTVISLHTIRYFLHETTYLLHTSQTHNWETAWNRSKGSPLISYAHFKYLFKGYRCPLAKVWTCEGFIAETQALRIHHLCPEGLSASNAVVQYSRFLACTETCVMSQAVFLFLKTMPAFLHETVNLQEKTFL